MIDNTVKQVATSSAMVHFLWSQRSFLGLPALFFICATAIVFGQLSLVMFVKYSSYVNAITVVTLGILSVALMRRFTHLGAVLRRLVDVTGGDDGFDEKKFAELK